MTAAFKSTYADWKLIKTRSVVQVVFEVPLHEADAAYDVLGGMPDPSKERWFGIAAIKEPAAPSCAVAKPQPVPDKPQAGAKRDWRDLPPAQQAGIRCSEPSFKSFLREEYVDVWRETAGFISAGEVTSEDDRAAECVRLICDVSSRSDLNANHKARVLWHQLNDQFGAWMRVGA